MVEWKKELKSYEKLKCTIDILPENSQKEAMVPLGPLVRVPGIFVDPNKILALLGDDWWAHVNTDTAKKIIDHRIQVCESNLDPMVECKENSGDNKGKNLLKENNGSITGHLSLEEYKRSEDEHRKMVLRQRKKVRDKQIEIRKNRLNQSKSQSIMSDEDAMARLDALELEESNDYRSYSPLRIRYKSSPNVYQRSMEENELTPQDLYEKFYEKVCQFDDGNGSTKDDLKGKLRKSVSWKESMVEEAYAEPVELSHDEHSPYIESEVEPKYIYNPPVASHVVARDTTQCESTFTSRNAVSNFQKPSNKKVSLFKASRKKAI